MESFVKDLEKSLKAITKLLKDNDINFTFIGGAARNQYKYLKTTEDVDLLIDVNDKQKVLDLPIGFIRKLNNRGKKFKLHEPETDIDVIYSGEMAGSKESNIPYENPKKITAVIRGMPFISLKQLIRYKLASGIYGHLRFKDFDDIIELIKQNKLPLDYADKFEEVLKNKYIELWHELNN